MTSCCHRRRMPWNEATGAIARCKNKSTGYARRCRSVPAWRWIWGVKPTPKAGNKPSPHAIVHGLDKPGVFTTVSDYQAFFVSPSAISTHRYKVDLEILRVFKISGMESAWSL